MKRIFHHYEKWEDWKDGLYALDVQNPEEILIARATRLLRDVDHLRLAMLRVVHRWPNSAEVNLSNTSRNRQAWLGQAAACWACGATEDLTKEAWHRLTIAEQDAANLVADYVIAVWEQACSRQN